MLVGTFQRLAGKIESIWAASGVGQEYVDIMRRSLPSRVKDEGKWKKGPSGWVLIPNICCGAMGGDPEWADEVSLAWLLFNIAADVFDSVEDQDQPEAWWRDIGPAVGLNAASGLFFTASLALNQLFKGPAGIEAANEVSQRFYSQLMQMSAGQHRDLTLDYLTLEDYWEIAAGKSGSFFSLASWAGARLACQDQERLQAMNQYGHHFGLLVQLLDDLQDFRQLQDRNEGSVEPKAILRSFASAYALDVFTGKERGRLLTLLGQMAGNPEDAIRVSTDSLEMIERSGAALYLTIEVERHRGQALEALDRAQPAAPEREQLIALLPDLQSI